MIFNIAQGIRNDELGDLLRGNEATSTEYINYTTRILPSSCCQSMKKHGVTFLQCSYIGQGAFRSNTYLYEISFPRCQVIGTSAFAFCTQLALGYSRSDTGKIGNYSFPECREIGSHAFQSCTKIKSIYLPKCQNISEYAFSNCTQLTALDLPMCTSIGTYCFHNAGFLETVNLPKLLTCGSSPFNNCVNLKEVRLGAGLEESQTLTLSGYGIIHVYPSQHLSLYLLSTKMIQLASITTIYFNSASGTASLQIYVPSELLEAYKSATNWASLSSHFVAIS